MQNRSLVAKSIPFWIHHFLNSPFKSRFPLTGLKRNFFSVILAFIFSSLLISAASQTYYKLVDMNKSLNIRSGPGASEAILGSIPKGSRCILFLGEREGDWIKIQFKDFKGWSNAQFLIADSEEYCSTKLSANIKSKSSATSDYSGIWFFALIVIFIAVIILATGLSRRCPSCHKWWSRKLMRTEEIGREGGYKTVTRYDIQRDKDGNEIGRTERKEQVHVTKITYKNYYKCNKCGYAWSSISISEKEG